jgi:hypothetical protein
VQAPRDDLLALEAQTEMLALTDKPFGQKCEDVAKEVCKVHNQKPGIVLGESMKGHRFVRVYGDHDSHKYLIHPDQSAELGQGRIVCIKKILPKTKYEYEGIQIVLVGFVSDKSCAPEE